MKRIYVAGAYSADNVLEVLHNIRKGIRASVEVMLAGYAPFSPWLDYQFVLMLQEHEELSVQQFYDYSMAWLEASDAVLVLPDSENSEGTQAEILRANELDIPVFYSQQEFMENIKP